ncbi:hypothetical protein D3C86_1937820 [compost metagenome]
MLSFIITDTDNDVFLLPSRCHFNKSIIEQLIIPFALDRFQDKLNYHVTVAVIGHGTKSCRVGNHIRLVIHNRITPPHSKWSIRCATAYSHLGGEVHLLEMLSYDEVG